MGKRSLPVKRDVNQARRSAAKMRLLLLGTGEFAVPALRALGAAGHEIVRAVSQPDRPAGRGRVIQPTPVHAAAAELGIPHEQTDDVNQLDLNVLTAGAEIGVVAAFGQKIGPVLLSALPRRCVNIHASLLPKYRGAAPYQWAILNGEVETGVTVFQLDEKWDAGPIWWQQRTAIGPQETADELHDRLALLGAEAIVTALSVIASGTAEPRPQDKSAATRAPKLTRADAFVDWNAPAARVVRRIHGLWSWPAATCLYSSRTGREERLQLARAALADEGQAPTPAFSAGAFHPDSTVQCGAGRIQLLEVKPAGGRLMPFVDFANGRRLAPPDRLLPLPDASEP